MRTVRYVIGGLCIAAQIPKQWNIITEERYHAFSAEEQKEDIRVVFHDAEEFALVDGIPVFADSRNRVFQKKDCFYRYKGVALQKYPDSWESCIRIPEDPFGVLDVYVKTEQHTLAENKLVEALGLDYLLGRCGKVILHSSFIKVGEKGILFSAPSGTGKSTQADLWNKYAENVAIINGDRAILGLQDGIVTAEGLPFCGSSGIARNQRVPLSAIVVLRQGTENTLKRIAGAAAVRYLLSECVLNLWDGAVMEKVMAMIQQTAERIPVYYFCCVPNESAVYKLQKELYGRGSK